MIPNEAMLARLKKQYPEGTRIRLLHMNDPHAVPQGTLGTVYGIDDTGSLLVRWDNGQGLNVLYGVDRVERVSGNLEKEGVNEMSHQMNTIWNYSQSILQESTELKAMIEQLYDAKEGRALNGKKRTELLETVAQTQARLREIAQKLGG